MGRTDGEPNDIKNNINVAGGEQFNNKSQGTSILVRTNSHHVIIFINQLLSSIWTDVE